MANNKSNQKLRTITLEEHYATPDFIQGPGQQLTRQVEETKDHPALHSGAVDFLAELTSLGERRVADMDVAGINVQVLSLTEARTFLEGLPASPKDRERIAHGNAEKLLGLSPLG